MALSDKLYCSSTRACYLSDSDAYVLSVCKLLKPPSLEKIVWPFKSKWRNKSTTYEVFWCSFGSKGVYTTLLSQ